MQEAIVLYVVFGCSLWQKQGYHLGYNLCHLSFSYKTSCQGRGIPGLIILMLCDYSKIIPLRSKVLLTHAHAHSTKIYFVLAPIHFGHCVLL